MGARRTVATVAAALALLAAVAGSCGGDGGEPAGLAAIDAQALLGRAADRMEQLESFRFDLTHENGATVIARGLLMERARGEVVGSDRLRAEVRARAGPLAVDIEIRIVGEQGWMTNPLTGRWEREDLTLASIFDPVGGVTALMRAASDARVVARESIEGADYYRVEATVDSADLGLLIPGAEAGRTLPAQALVSVEDATVRRVEIRGAASALEAEEIVRRLEISDVGGEFSIEAPR
ncbi:MAG: LppX_LprAFG lipoprotein [Chloroflexi bacterium]|nr:LppX_LprAFG lipoprotein [Chloroflexota bacterium]